MKILVIHTYYQIPGGEDKVFEEERKNLILNGHLVDQISFSNRQLENYSKINQLICTNWNKETYRRVKEEIRNIQPDIIHIHNTFPFASPSIIYAAKAENKPVVMTLHNYRLLCINALFFRNGKICENCLGKNSWQGIINKCYRDNYATSIAVATLQTSHRLFGTWNLVDSFIALTEFARQKFIEGGLPEHKITVKPNFTVPSTKLNLTQNNRKNYILFVGRLSTEKGIPNLLDAWNLLTSPIILKIAGDGPLKNLVCNATETNRNIDYLGQCSSEEIKNLMSEAMCLVFPSECYEGFPMVIVESLSLGLPIVTSNIGSQATIVRHGMTGLHFQAGNAIDLAEKIAWVINNSQEIETMRTHAYKDYILNYTPEQNYQKLINIYHDAIKNYI